MGTRFQSFYTTNDYIKNYMIQNIAPHPQDLILEPCGGDGAFVDALLSYDPNLSIHTCDLDGQAVSLMKEKYRDRKQIQIRQADALTDKFFDRCSISGYYDKVIGNPPYGAWQDYEKRELLKKRYPGFHVKETYALFLIRGLSLLKAGGLLSFIIPDTWLYLHNHSALRSYLLNNALIQEIALFPSQFFPGISYGYSKLCIVTLQKPDKQEIPLDHSFTVITGFQKDSDLADIHIEGNHLTRLSMTQKQVWQTDSHTFLIDTGGLDALILNSRYSLCDLADCVTGLYTGDNKRFLYCRSKEVKYSRDYPAADPSLISMEPGSLDGITSERRLVPLAKGNSPDRYCKTVTDWYIDWGQDAVSYYRSAKKARFQNPGYYFRTGIALPMIKGAKTRAVLMSGMVFDQSIVGIFPKDPQYLYYLLGLLNSDLFDRILRILNPTANNSANYLKKAPVPFPDSESLKEVNELVGILLKNPDNQKAEGKLNEIFGRLYKEMLPQKGRIPRVSLR